MSTQQKEHAARRTMLLATAVLIAMLALAAVVDANPRAQYAVTQAQKSHVDACAVKVDRAVLELCQRCAKSTKSDIVYPMCCEDREEAREWCDKYMKFGIQ